MKKVLLTLALLVSCLSMSAQKRNIIITSSTGGHVPQSPDITLPVLSAEYDAEELTFSISNYTGEVDILIMKQPHTFMYDDTMNVVGSDSLDVDLTSYPTGTYVLYIRLDNNDLYEGVFELE